MGGRQLLNLTYQKATLEATAMGRPLYEHFGFAPMEHEMELPENNR